MKKTKSIYDYILFIIGIIIFIIIILIAIKYGRNNINDKKMAEIAEKISDMNYISESLADNVSENQNNEKQIEIDGHTYIGIIRIPKIDLEYPILSETSNELMKISITKFWGGKLNCVGNITLAGHNNRDGTMFGKTKKLEIGDTIEIIDLDQNKVTYEIFSQYIIDPTDVDCIKSVYDNTREITLITCTNGNKNRLITKAKEI